MWPLGLVQKWSKLIRGDCWTFFFVIWTFISNIRTRAKSYFPPDFRQRKAVLEIPIPAKQVTSVAFGGPNLDILYVTTAATARDGVQPPQAGHLFKVTGLGVKGLPGVNVRVWFEFHTSLRL